MATGVLRSSKSRGAVWILALSLGASAQAGSLRVTVVDEHGPVAHVAVYAVPSKRAERTSREHAGARAWTRPTTRSYRTS